MGGPAANPKAIGMHCSRRAAHYFIFIMTMKLNDILLENVSLNQCNYHQMVLYAMYSATGMSLHHRTIKAATIND
jgi:hypothetical protein